MVRRGIVAGFRGNGIIRSDRLRDYISCLSRHLHDGSEDVCAFNAHGCPCWTITDTGWPTIDVKTQITLDGDSPMSCGVRH